MKILRQAALILVLLIVLACSWLKPMDEPAKAQGDAGLKRALISFASARAIGGLLSVVQAAQVDIQPAGLGVTLSPGQLLAPVNDLVKHFADLMLMACVAFGIQKVLIGISGHLLISAALTVTTVAWAAVKLRGHYMPTWLAKSFVILLMLRFAIPVAMLGTNELTQKFLKADYEAAQTAITAEVVKAGSYGVPNPPPAVANGWLPSMPSVIPNLAQIRARYDEMRIALEQSTEHVVKLMVVFLLQTLLLPLVIIWLMYGIARVTVERPRLSASPDR